MTALSPGHEESGAGILSIPGEWVDEALCAQTDPESFFPEKGGSSRDAKGTCLRCPVAIDCLEYALDHGERHGIWGAHSERERRALSQDPAARMRAIDELEKRDLPEPNLTATSTPAPQKEPITMAEDIHGEPIGDDRVTYANPPTLTPVAAPVPAGAPLPPEIAAAARLLARTEGHPDRKIRSARRIVAQSLLHLDELVREHEALDRTVDRSLALVQNAQSAARATAPTPATPAATGSTATGQPRKRAKSPAQQLIEQHQLDPADIRRYGLERQLCGERGGLSLQVVEKYLAHRGTA